MVITAPYRFSLDKTSRKFRCPTCGQKTFVQYVDTTTGKYIADHVGRCDRENNCSYHITPKDYFKETGYVITETIEQKRHYQPLPQKPVDFIPMQLLERSMNGNDKSSFALFLIDTFGHTQAEELLLRYMVGRSKRNNASACIFWRIDIEGRVRSGKIMQYDQKTGKRNKDVSPTWVHSQLDKEFNFQNCFFGEHLLAETPGKTVAIVESEKTAILCSFFMPQYIWIATGGKTGLKLCEYNTIKPLSGHDVIMFPDFGKPDKSLKTPYIKWTEIAKLIAERLTDCRVNVSSLLENNVSESMRINDIDLADVLLNRCPDTGVALTEFGYPAIWDKKITS